MSRRKMLFTLALCFLLVLTSMNLAFAETLPGNFSISSPKPISTFSYSSNLSISWTSASGAKVYKLSMKDLKTNSLVYDNYPIGNVKSFSVPSSKITQSHKYKISIGAFASSTSKDGKWQSVEPVYISSSTYKKISEYVVGYGQFAYKDNSDATITIDSVWKSDNIITMSVTGIPKISSVTIHKNAKSAFNAAFQKIRTTQVIVDKKGTKKYLKDLISTYDGTFVPRHKNWNVKEGLSNHSWGTAIDINASTHTGKIDAAKSPYDPNYLLNAAFTSAGFYWGNRYSDSMHYETVDR